MKTLYLLTLTMLLASCAKAQPNIDAVRLDCTGQTLPKIRHMIEMKVLSDTLFFVYECDEGFGQRILRRATIDKQNHRLVIGSEIGRRDNGSYISFMPYPFVGEDGKMSVAGQDDGEIYKLADDSVLVRTKTNLFNAKVPLAISQYAQDIFSVSPNKYVFIGREPTGGAQYAMSVDMYTARMDTLRQISVSSTQTTWMSNAGELVYSNKYNRMAFAYRLHPIVDIFNADGTLVNKARIGKDTFNPNTLNEADFEELNTLHTVDATYTQDYIYALHWACKYTEIPTVSPTIYKIDWNGNIINRYVSDSTFLYGIAAIDDSNFIGWTGKKFVILTVPR